MENIQLCKNCIENRIVGDIKLLFYFINAFFYNGLYGTGKFFVSDPD